MSTTTTNRGYVKPTIGGDSGNWGTELNGTLDQIDTDMAAVIVTANAALPKAGGALTGRLDTKTATAAVATGSSTLDLSAAQYFADTISGATTFVFSNCPTGFFGFVLELTNPGSAAITWPASVKWPGGSPPALSVSGIDLLSFVTRDGGATWRGTVMGKAYA